jgi:hypothetical protein
MKLSTRLFILAPVILLATGVASADDYADTVTLFKNAGDSAAFFSQSYGYTLFPTR